MKKLLSILLLTFVIGCATPYQETSKWNWTTGGYSDTKIQADVFKVSFSGSKQTSTSLSESFALLRAAEVVLREGYRYFIVMDDQSGRVRRGAGILWTPFCTNNRCG